MRGGKNAVAAGSDWHKLQARHESFQNFGTAQQH